MSAYDIDPLPAKGLITITISTSAHTIAMAEDDTQGLLKTLDAIRDWVEANIAVLPYEGGEWEAETHNLPGRAGAARIDLT